MRQALLIAIALLCGCVFNDHPAVRPLRPLEIPTAPYRPRATAGLTGTLMYEGGCLIFRDEESGSLLMPIWPAGSSFNGSALSYHLPGKSDQWIAIAQEVLLYGQPLAWETFADPLYQPVQHQCGAYKPYFVTAVRPAD